MEDSKENYRLYMQNAQEMLDTADENFNNQRYRSACNRAYYGMFYAASALLFSKGKSFGKHSAVLPLFASTLSRQASSTKSGATPTDLSWKVGTPQIMRCTNIWKKTTLLR